MNIKGKKLNISISSLIRSNKFLLIFSLIASFCLWLWVSIEKSPVVETVISSVPVQIELEDSIPSQMGLSIFGNSKYTVDVTVSGKKFIVSSLTADDIRVVAQTNYVDSAGTKTLTLKASNNGTKEFDITSLSQNYVSVYFDFYKEAEFALTPNVTSEVDKQVVDGFFLGEPILSKNTVTVSGPSTEVNKITGVNANYTITASLETTTTVNPDIELVGASQSQLANTSIDLGETVITMTLPVLKEVVLPASVSFKNAPADYISSGISYTVSPNFVRVGVPVEQLEQTKEIVIGTVDFADINAGNNNFNFTSDSITDYVLINSSSVFRVNVNMNGCTQKTVTVPVSKVSISAQNPSFTSSITSKDNLSVKLVGPADALAALDVGSIIAELDLSEAELTEGANTVYIKLSLSSGNTNCWIYGDYAVTVTSVKA